MSTHDQLGPSLAQLTATELSEVDVSIVLHDSQTNLRPYHLNATRDLLEAFRLTLQDFIGEAAQSAQVDFSAGRKLDPAEIATLSLEQAPVAAALVPQLEQPGAQMTFELKDASLSRLRLFCISARASDELWVHATRKLTRGFRLAKSSGLRAWAVDGVYAELPDNTLHFNTNLDALIWGQQIYVSHLTPFEDSFELTQLAANMIETTLKSALSEIPVANLGSVISTATDDHRLHGKVRSVAERLEDAHFKSKLTIENIERLIKGREDIDLEIRVIDGRRQIVYDDSLQGRWTLLKVLDDDYLLSELTDIKYEANSKIRSG